MLLKIFINIHLFMKVLYSYTIISFLIGSIFNLFFNWSIIALQRASFCCVAMHQQHVKNGSSQCTPECREMGMSSL